MTVSLALIVTAFILAGAVKGLFGMGLPTVSMGLLAMTMPPAQAAALLIIPTVATNLWQLFGPGLGATLRRFSTMIVGMCVGTVIGAQVLTGGSTRLASLALGAVLIAYAAYGLLAKPMSVPPWAEQWLSPAVGLASGVVNGATGISVVPLAPYVNSLGLARDSLIQTLGVMFTAAMLALAACLAWTGHLHLAAARTSALSLLPVAIGMWIGRSIRVRLHAQVFQRWFFIGLFVLGSCMIVRAL